MSLPRGFIELRGAHESYISGAVAKQLIVRVEEIAYVREAHRYNNVTVIGFRHVPERMCWDSVDRVMQKMAEAQ